MTQKNQNVTVFMFHSVMSRLQDCSYSHLTEAASDFYRMMAFLKRKGYSTLTLKELYQYVSYGERIPNKAIVLTFDDGYLDNWVTVFPILKYFEFKATIFVCCDFIDDEQTEIRRIVDNVSDLIYANEREIDGDIREIGYLSWVEIKEMSRSGLIDIQSHTLTHTWYPTTPCIIDYYHPGAARRYPWIVWNRERKKKIEFIDENFEKCVPYGTPIYENKRAIVARKYEPDRALDTLLVEYVHNNGGENFFKKDDWKDILESVKDNFCNNKKLRGYFETEDEYMRRIKYELEENKKRIEERINNKVEFVCWPGGDYNDYSLNIALELGHLASTVKSGRNRYMDDPTKIHRTYASNPYGKYKFPWKYKIAVFNYYLNRFEGSLWAKVINKIYTFQH